MLRSRAFSLARSSPQRVLLRGLAQKPSQPGGRQKPEFNAVDPSLVNVQNIAVDGDALSKAAIRQLTAGMLLLDRDRYKLARGKFAAWNGGDAHEAAWVTANAVGVALLCEGRAAAGATRLREALKGCKALSDKGMGSDSYSDMAGLLNDLAAALLAPRLRALAAGASSAGSDEAYNLLKRAKFMAERAYRPNWDLKQALNCNLSIALLFQNELPQAKEVAEHAIKAAEALDAVGAGCGMALTPSQRGGLASSLWALSEVALREGDAAAAVHAARRGVESMDEARGKASGDGARARLALSRALWLNAAQSGGGVNKRSKAAEDGYREALEVSQQALDGFKEAGLKRTHVDVAFALVNQLYMKRRLGIAATTLKARCRYAVDGFARTADSSEVITSSETSGDGVASGDTSGEAPSGEEGGDEAETLAALRLAHGAALAATESDAGERAGMPAVVPILRRGLGLEDVLASAKKVAQKAAQAKKAPTSK